ncbi:hypothetical protein QYM36_013115 [Artemia franciscana]|uniref:Uncharacterized protein n=1 Tax=Artemia franciscana TaxID=6661 RepID=A0AA88L0Y8_ARTSF|nr:hypothetical protein QYM36_013115 [Artemia franciscana]
MNAIGEEDNHEKKSEHPARLLDLTKFLHETRWMYLFVTDDELAKIAAASLKKGDYQKSTDTKRLKKSIIKKIEKSSQVPYAKTSPWYSSEEAVEQEQAATLPLEASLNKSTKRINKERGKREHN